MDEKKITEDSLFITRELNAFYSKCMEMGVNPNTFGYQTCGVVMMMFCQLCKTNIPPHEDWKKSADDCMKALWKIAMKSVDEQSESSNG